MRSPTSAAVALATLAAVCSTRGAAEAAADQPRVAVLPFGGDGGIEVQRAVTRALTRHGHRLISADDFRATAAQLAPNVEGAEAIRAIAAELKLVAVVMGKVTTSKRRRVARIVVRDGRDGETVEDISFAAHTRHALARAVERDFWKKLGATFRRAPPAAAAPALAEPISTDDPFAAPPPSAAPAPPPPAPSPPEEVIVRRPPPRREAPPEEPAPRTGAQPAYFELSVGPRAVFRQLTYVSDPNDDLTEFRTQRPAPALGVSLSAFARLGFPRLGLSVSAEQATRTQAFTSGELGYHTFSSDYTGALLIGVPSRHLVADLALGGGRQRFALLPQGDAASHPRPVPNVTYDYLRAGLTLHVYTGTPFGIFAGGYYRHVLSAGLIRSTDWFPSARVWGAEGTVGVSYRILTWFEARLHGDVRMYRFRMDRKSNDGHLTDGALDQYWTGSLSLVALFGGADRR
jgi:hypothetical protein